MAHRGADERGAGRAAQAFRAPVRMRARDALGERVGDQQQFAAAPVDAVRRVRFERDRGVRRRRPRRRRPDEHREGRIAGRHQLGARQQVVALRLARQ